MIRSLGLLTAAFLLLGMARATGDPWRDPTPVTILGYEDHAMEPFISRDGRLLFWNNLNRPHVNTNLHWAICEAPDSCQYQGEVRGTDTGGLEGVPAMDLEGRFYYLSPKMAANNSTIIAGRFEGGEVLDPAPVAGDYPVREKGAFTLGPEISPDGRTLYYVQARRGGGRKTMNLAMAELGETGFRRAATDLFANVNSEALEYAPAISSDGLELFFTRLTKNGRAKFEIMQAVRGSLNEPFGPPVRMEAIRGLVEGPTITGDGRRLYYHRKVPGGACECLAQGRYEIFFVEREE